MDSVRHAAGKKKTGISNHASPTLWTDKVKGTRSVVIRRFWITFLENGLYFGQFIGQQFGNIPLVIDSLKKCTLNL